jgi:hypothetical protein
MTKKVVAIVFLTRVSSMEAMWLISTNQGELHGSNALAFDWLISTNHVDRYVGLD